MRIEEDGRRWDWELDYEMDEVGRKQYEEREWREQGKALQGMGGELGWECRETLREEEKKQEELGQAAMEKRLEKWAEAWGKRRARR